MTFSTLIAKREHFGTEWATLRATYLGVYNSPGSGVEKPARDVDEMFLDEARAAMKSDLRSALGLWSVSDYMDVLDRIVAAPVVDLLQQAIAAKQIAAVYTRWNEGADSMNDRLRRQYEASYNALKAQFQNLTGPDPVGSTSRSVQVVM